MIRTGEEYRESIRDGREVWMNGERVDDVTAHPAFGRWSTCGRGSTTWRTTRPPATSCPTMTRPPASETRSDCGWPHYHQDWHDKRRAVDAVMDDVGGVVIRVGDETVGEMWSLFDGQDVLNEVDPQF